MKKVLVLLLVAFIALPLFSTGSKENPGNDDSLQKVLDKGVFILGLDDSFPPMGYRDDNNRIVGYDIDLAKEVCSRLGVGFIAQPIDWNAKEQELNTGNIDCIWNGFTVMEERAKNVLFSDPYLPNNIVVIVKADSPITSVDQLAGKVIGVQAGSSGVEVIENDPRLAAAKEVVEFKDYLTALLDLDIGGTDAIVIDLIIANDNIARSGKDFRILDERLNEEVFAVGFRKTDYALRDKVNEILLDMANDGTLAKITTSWFGSDISLIGK